jgi:hypothetical protein
MPGLTRRHDPDARQETWLINYGDVRVGTIAERVGKPNRNASLAMVLRLLSREPSPRVHPAARPRASRRPGAPLRWLGRSSLGTAPKPISRSTGAVGPAMLGNAPCGMLGSNSRHRSPTAGRRAFVARRSASPTWIGTCTPHMPHSNAKSQYWTHSRVPPRIASVTAVSSSTKYFSKSSMMKTGSPVCLGYRCQNSS